MLSPDLTRMTFDPSLRILLQSPNEIFSNTFCQAVHTYIKSLHRQIWFVMKEFLVEWWICRGRDNGRKWHHRAVLLGWRKKQEFCWEKILWRDFFSLDTEWCWFCKKNKETMHKSYDYDLITVTKKYYIVKNVARNHSSYSR